ncbi:MAG: HD domain-containing protein [Clostridiales bacterium]|nr:HD domain-containing protein [Candidatus Scatonaster coprocaballi]
MKKCPDCGMTIANQAIRCPKCKYDFTDGQGNVAGVPTTSSNGGADVKGRSASVGSIMPMINVTKDNVDELYNDLKSKIIKRKTEFDHFIDFLENRTSWLTAPAELEGSLAFEKGLLIHSVGVAKQLLRIKDTLMPQLDDESAIIIALFHDVGKVGVEGKPLFLLEEKTTTSTLGLSFGGRSLSVAPTYTINPKLVHMSVGVRSLFLVSQYMLLSDDEAQAISYQDDIKLVEGKENPFTMILHTANTWQTKIYENEEVVKQYSFASSVAND